MILGDDYEAVLLDALARAVGETLERKRRLGQYAVLWRDGNVVRVGPDAPDFLYRGTVQSQPAHRSVAEPREK